MTRRYWNADVECMRIRSTHTTLDNWTAVRRRPERGTASAYNTTYSLTENFALQSDNLSGKMRLAEKREGKTKLGSVASV